MVENMSFLTAFVNTYSLCLYPMVDKELNKIIIQSAHLIRIYYILLSSTGIDPAFFPSFSSTFGELQVCATTPGIAFEIR